jgi:hypothetical protein
VIAAIALRLIIGRVDHARSDYSGARRDVSGLGRMLPKVWGRLYSVAGSSGSAAEAERRYPIG